MAKLLISHDRYYRSHEIVFIIIFSKCWTGGKQLPKTTDAYANNTCNRKCSATKCWAFNVFVSLPTYCVCPCPCSSISKWPKFQTHSRGGSLRDSLTPHLDRSWESNSASLWLSYLLLLLKKNNVSLCIIKRTKKLYTECTELGTSEKLNNSGL